jgi:acyl carrier protein
MEEKIKEILKKMHPDARLDASVRLFDDGVLDSLDIVTLVSEMNAAFGVRIPASEILPDNFNSVASLAAMVRRLDDV